MIQHTKGPWWYGWENWLDSDDACYSIGAGGGGTPRPHKVLFYTAGQKQTDHANAIIVSFAAEMYEKILVKDWDGLEAVKDEIQDRMRLASTSFSKRKKQQESDQKKWLRIGEELLEKTRESYPSTD